MTARTGVRLHLRTAIVAVVGATSMCFWLPEAVCAVPEHQSKLIFPTDCPLQNPEGPVISADVLVGPIDIHRKYRSMEGPFVNEDFKVGELLDSKSVSVKESRVYFTEDRGQAPAMMGSGPSMFGQDPATAATAGNEPVTGLIARVGKKRELYWFKGIKLEVIDENDHVMPTAEFICHFNLDISVSRRNEVFPKGERTNNPRLISLTQGQTSLYFPEGFGVPVASDELWRFGFQAANRTSDQHRRLRQRCTVYFIKDSDLKKPITALLWYVPYGTVVVERNTKEAAEAEHSHSPTCLPTLPGVMAPNRGAQLSLLTDSMGRRLAGHWTVPPGEHKYSSPIIDERDPGFSKKDRRIHAIWTHIHPLCATTALVQCNGEQRRKLYEANIKTKTEGGLEIQNIQTITSREGILLRAGQRYELEGVYENTTGVPQDSMISHGIFFADDTFKAPAWVKSPGDEVQPATASTAPAPGKPAAARLFDTNLDGPLLSADKYVELETSAGKLVMVLEPKLAPKHATQMYNLLIKGAYAGTPVFQYHPGFLIQMAGAEFKTEGQPPLTQQLRGLLCRLPLEVASGGVKHDRLALSMARDGEPDSAVSSFCIMLSTAPQMDGKYTIFGHLLGDRTTEATLESIGRGWPATTAVINAAREVVAPEAAVLTLSQPSLK